MPYSQPSDGSREQHWMEYDGAWKCFRCGNAWGAIQNPSPCACDPSGERVPASCIETQGEWVPRSTGSKGGRRVVAFKPDASYYGGFAEVLVAEVFGGVMPDGGSHGPWSQPADEAARAEMEANVALICSAKDFRSALQRIAEADLKRCSAGWLQKIAVEALQRHEKASGPQGYPEAEKAP